MQRRIFNKPSGSTGPRPSASAPEELQVTLIRSRRARRRIQSRQRRRAAESGSESEGTIRAVTPPQAVPVVNPTAPVSRPEGMVRPTIR
ncbi:hypothetical protein DMENIID0001_041320 [Sergentomyia squamirostris]